jgi:hypothetical protein
MIHGSIPSFTNAFFEMMSGYTTSGATILTDIEVVPHGLLFWRSQTHLLGGMGFLTLTVIFLPHGMGGLRIFRAESSPGQVITKEKFHARNRDTMVRLWMIYMGLNLAETLLLCFGGMSVFDSLCHAFGTVSTSGYSPWNASIGHYNNAYFDWIIILFMFLGGMTFVLFYQMIRGDWESVRINTEFRWYVALMLFFCGMVSWILWKENTYGLMDAIRYGTFQVTSLLTTTGFTTADYEQWPQASQMFLVCGLFYRRLCRVHHQRHQDRSLCGPVQIHVSRHQKNLFSAHVHHIRAVEPAAGGRLDHLPVRLLFHCEHLHGAGRRVRDGAHRRHGLCHGHEFGHRRPDEHRAGFWRGRALGKLCLHFRCRQVVSFLEHAGRAAGDVQRAGYLLSILLEKIT